MQNMSKKIRYAEYALPTLLMCAFLLISCQPRLRVGTRPGGLGVTQAATHDILVHDTMSFKWPLAVTVTVAGTQYMPGMYVTKT
jgi:hypothetical protein